MNARFIIQVVVYGFLGAVAAMFLIIGILGAIIEAVRAEEPRGRCVNLDARGIIATSQGYAVALCPAKDDEPCQHTAVLKGNVRFHDGPAALCMPAAGDAPLLWLPSTAWPAFAGGNTNIAMAHAGYDWIRKHHGESAQSGGWQDGDFGGCCGKQDCFPVKADFEVREIEGKKVPGFRVHDEFGDFVPLGRPHSDVSRDPEGRHWRCYNMHSIGGRAPRHGCFFYQPGSG